MRRNTLTNRQIIQDRPIRLAVSGQLGYDVQGPAGYRTYDTLAHMLNRRYEAGEEQRETMGMLGEDSRRKSRQRERTQAIDDAGRWGHDLSTSKRERAPMEKQDRLSSAMRFHRRHEDEMKNIRNMTAREMMEGRDMRDEDFFSGWEPKQDKYKKRKADGEEIEETRTSYYYPPKRMHRFKVEGFDQRKVTAHPERVGMYGEDHWQEDWRYPDHTNMRFTRDAGASFVDPFGDYEARMEDKYQRNETKSEIARGGNKIMRQGRFHGIDDDRYTGVRSKNVFGVPTSREQLEDPFRYHQLYHDRINFDPRFVSVSRELRERVHNPDYNPRDIPEFRNPDQPDPRNPGMEF